MDLHEKNVNGASCDCGACRLKRLIGKASQPGPHDTGNGPCPCPRCILKRVETGVSATPSEQETLLPLVPLTVKLMEEASEILALLARAVGPERLSEAGIAIHPPTAWAPGTGPVPPDLMETLKREHLAGGQRKRNDQNPFGDDGSEGPPEWFDPIRMGPLGHA